MESASKISFLSLYNFKAQISFSFLISFINKMLNSSGSMYIHSFIIPDSVGMPPVFSIMMVAVGLKCVFVLYFLNLF